LTHEVVGGRVVLADGPVAQALQPLRGRGPGAVTSGAGGWILADRAQRATKKVVFQTCLGASVRGAIRRVSLGRDAFDHRDKARLVWCADIVLSK
jgi:hypothetical protein